MVQAEKEAARPGDDWYRWYGRTALRFRATPVYRLRLNGPVPSVPVVFPVQIRRGNVKRGAALIRGHWRFDTSSLSVGPDHAPWGPEFPSSHFADRLHRFEWLTDLLAIGPAGIGHARALVIAWIKAFGKWDGFAWRTDVTARRLINWLFMGSSLFEPLDETTRSRLMESIGRQLRHLNASGGDCLYPVGRGHIAMAMSMAGLCLPGSDRYVEIGLDMLESEYTALILDDGGHRSRSAQALADALIELNMLEELLVRTRRKLPLALVEMRLRMVAMIGFATAPGGSLLVTNGGGSGVPGLSSLARESSGVADVKQFTFARLSGYHRVDSDPLTLFVDTGVAPDSEFAHTAHSGVLSIEVHDGVAPMITSCGAHSDSSPSWRSSVRSGVAHSVLVLDETDPVLYRHSDSQGVRVPVGPPQLTAHRMEENDQYLIECQHSGWVERYGLVYGRRLYVSRDGEKLIGYESLFRPVSASGFESSDPVPYALRFHLHPDIEVSAGDDATTVWLGVRHTDRIWRLRSDFAIEIDDSLHAGDGQRTRTHQLVIRGAADRNGDGQSSPNLVRWALTLSDRGSGRR